MMTAADKFTWTTYDTLLRRDFVSFAQRCFRELSPRTQFMMNWHIEIIAAKLMAVRAGQIRRLIINMPPRYLKSLLASVAFPAWCLGHDPAAQILCVSYAQELGDKLSRDCRRILGSDWYQRLFPTRLSQERQAVPEFETTAQGGRLATSVGGVLTGRGADMITDIRLAKGFAISPWSSMLSAVASLTRLWRRSSMSAWPWPPAPWRWRHAGARQSGSPRRRAIRLRGLRRQTGSASSQA